MTDTNRHDSPADRRSAGRRQNRLLHAQCQKVRDGQGSLMLFSQFPDPDVQRSNQRASFLGGANP
ncbi:hypothetical protein ES703_80574 [subsurface metagenome]